MSYLSILIVAAIVASLAGYSSRADTNRSYFALASDWLNSFGC